MTRERIGTVTDVRDRFNLPDGAAAWEAIIAGRYGLSAVRGEDPAHPSLWTVYQNTEGS